MKTAYQTLGLAALALLTAILFYELRARAFPILQCDSAEQVTAPSLYQTRS